MGTDLMLPTFIVIGAAKAGTTALYWYLAEHPAVYMSPVKETNFFAYGVDARGQLLYGDPDVHHFPVKTLAEYEQLFAAAGDAKAVGEASPIYLECPEAAARIRQLIPHARIVCSIRHPVDRAYSDYQMYLRHRGQRLDPVKDLTPDARWARPDSRWLHVGRYYEQLSRYYELFPAAQIQVSLFDDLKRDALSVVQNVYRFVGVEPGFVPDVATPHAIGGMPTSRLVEGVLTNRTVATAAKRWLPVRVAHWVRRMRARNMQKAPALPTELRKELTQPFRDDIQKTSALIGRSLDHWL
jgi:Sulfotransferase family